MTKTLEVPLGEKILAAIDTDKKAKQQGYRDKIDKRWSVFIPSNKNLINSIVASITRAIYCVPTEVLLGHEKGLKEDCCIDLINLHTVHRGRLYHFIGTLTLKKTIGISCVLNIAMGCL
ncbi:MAG TPA: hypothetical protein PLY93_02970 [Turneriella sp.]|nr:hypothetical protein [Turneriella sp.]